MLMLILALTLGQVHAGKIIGGREAAPHSRPYMVLIERRLENGIQHCGGFLLNEDFVMTAAHCQAESYVVFLGLHNYNNRSERLFVHVSNAYPHPDYFSSYKNDIMLLKLSSKANSFQNVKPIALAGQDDGSLPKLCSASGWGRNDNRTNDLSPLLREINVTLIDNKKCHKTVYCSDGTNGPAEGDSGGPLVCEDGKAFGVVSAKFTPKNHRNETYNYFTKISVYRSWIDKIMNT